MEKIYELLKKLGIELSADQKKQLGEVAEKEFVTAAEHSAQKTKLEELTKQLADRDKDLEKLKADNKSEELTKQLSELSEKYKTATEQLAAQEQGYAAEKLLSGYKFASERVKNSVLEEFKNKGFKFENGAFVGGKEYLEELKKNEPDAFAAEKPGLLMGGTQSGVSTDENNLKSQIFGGFGLKND